MMIMEGGLEEEGEEGKREDNGRSRPKRRAYVSHVPCPVDVCGGESGVVYGLEGV